MTHGNITPAPQPGFFGKMADAVGGLVALTALHSMSVSGKRMLIEFLEPTITSARALDLFEEVSVEHDGDVKPPEGVLAVSCPHGESHSHWVPEVIDGKVVQFIDSKTNNSMMRLMVRAAHENGMGRALPLADDVLAQHPSSGLPQELIDIINGISRPDGEGSDA